MALAYGPRAGDQSSWAHAHAAHSAALQGRQDWLHAALAMQRAAEAEPDQARWAQERDRLLDCIPEAPAAALQVLRCTIFHACPCSRPGFPWACRYSRSELTEGLLHEDAAMHCS